METELCWWAVLTGGRSSQIQWNPHNSWGQCMQGKFCKRITEPGQNKSCCHFTLKSEASLCHVIRYVQKMFLWKKICFSCFSLGFKIMFVSIWFVCHDGVECTWNASSSGLDYLILYPVRLYRGITLQTEPPPSPPSSLTVKHDELLLACLLNGGEYTNVSSRLREGGWALVVILTVGENDWKCYRLTSVTENQAVICCRPSGFDPEVIPALGAGLPGFLEQSEWRWWSRNGHQDTATQKGGGLSIRVPAAVPTQEAVWISWVTELSPQNFRPAASALRKKLDSHSGNN